MSYAGKQPNWSKVKAGLDDQIRQCEREYGAYLYGSDEHSEKEVLAIERRLRRLRRTRVLCDSVADDA
jgi:hypothetical protein